MSSTANKQTIIKIVNGSKIYQGVSAIKDVDFDLFEGEVHALIGENGAGKSTLCKSLSGAIELTSGQILFDNVQRSFKNPAEALKVGIAMVYQETSLVPTMTVAQNIELGREKFYNRLSRLAIKAQQILQSMKFDVEPSHLVAMLGAGQKQMVEIARAIGHNARVIIFDEPTAMLTPEEKVHFFELIESLKRKGISVIFISHMLEEALAIADRITVLRDGQKIITDDVKAMTRESLVRHMVGRDLSQTHYVKRERKTRENQKKKKKVLVVENVTKGKMVKNMSFSVYSGEVTGIAGLIGSGRTEIAQIIVGAEKRDVIHGGMIYLNGRPVRYRVPKQAIDDGIVYVTEDRKTNGFFGTMNINDNIYFGWLATRMGRQFLISKKYRDEIGKKWVDRMNIRALNPKKAKVIELSGGNQQKVTISKSLVQKPSLVIFDEPTRGVDVNAIPEIHDLIFSLAEEDIAVVVISSYLPEILNTCDRILVARKGRIVEEFSSEEATEKKIMYAAIH